MGLLWDLLKDTVVSGAGVVGFMLGGPPGGALVGGIVGGLVALADGKDMGEVASAAMNGAIGGAFGGVGSGVKGAIFAKKSIELARNTTGAPAAKLAFNKSGRFTHEIPVKFGAAHVPPWKLYTGMVLTGLSTGVGYHKAMSESGGNNKSTLGQIPVIPIEGDAAPTGMPVVFMPDPTKLPDGLTLSSAVQQEYKRLPDMYARHWELFGKGGKSEAEKPKNVKVSDISGEEAANIENYVQRVQYLRTALEDMKEDESRIAQIDNRSAELSAEGQQIVGGSIKSLTEFAKVHPLNIDAIAELTATFEKEGTFFFDETKLNAEQLSEDNYVFALAESAADTGASVVQYYAEQFEELAKKVPNGQNKSDGNEKTTGDKKSDPVSTDTGNNTNNGGVYPTGYPYQPTNTTTGNTQQVATPQSWNGNKTDRTQQTTPQGVEKAQEAKDSTVAEDSTVAKDSTGANSSVSTTGDTALGGSSGNRIATSMNTPAQQVTTSGATDSALQQMTLPAVMQALMNGQQQQRPENQGTNRSAREGDPRQGRRIPAANTAPTQSSAPTTNQTQTPQANQTTSAAPVRAVSATGNTQSELTPVTGKSAMDPRSPFTYTFPDGRTQEVSVMVAMALDKAFDNKRDTDAREAYANTPAMWTDSRDIGRPADAFELMTGDVAVWASGPAESPGKNGEGVRTAILVRFGSWDSGTLEAVIDGELKPFAEDMDDEKGRFGAFAGFRHPKGIEKEAEAENSSSASVSVDQSGAMNAVTSA